MNLRKVLFWDTDQDSINWERHAAYVIERVARYGTLDEWQQLLQHYGEERVQKEVRQLRELDKKTLNYLSLRFNIPKESFRCYTHQQSTPTHYPS